MPQLQKVSIYLTWVFAGLMGLAGFISVLNDTLDIVTLLMAVVGSSTVARYR